MSPTLTSGVDYTNNPRLIPEFDESYAGARAEVAADLSVDTEVSSIHLVPKFLYVQYPNDPLLDRDDVYVTLSGRRAYETVTWNGSASYTQDTTITSEFGLTGFQDVNRDHEAVSVSLGPTWQATERLQVNAQAYGLDTTYENAQRTGLTDYTYGLVGVGTHYVLSETLIGGLQASVGQLDVPQTLRHSRDLEASLSVDWQLAERWRARFAYGPTRVEADYGDSQGNVYSASLTKDNLRSNFRLAFERDVTPTGRGVLVTREQVTLGLTYALTPRTTWTLATQAVRTKDAIEVAGISQTNEFGSVESNLRWRFAERWSVAFVAAGRYLGYEGRNDDAEGFTVSLGLSWNGQPRTISR
jgi:hypothetical protein